MLSLSQVVDRGVQPPASGSRPEFQTRCQASGQVPVMIWFDLAPWHPLGASISTPSTRWRRTTVHRKRCIGPTFRRDPAGGLMPAHEQSIRPHA
jgi:hypothetical protein